MSDTRAVGERWVESKRGRYCVKEWIQSEDVPTVEFAFEVGNNLSIEDAAYLVSGPRLAGENESLRAALTEIVTHGSDDNPCEHETINGCRAHIHKTALAALAREQEVT